MDMKLIFLTREKEANNPHKLKHFSLNTMNNVLRKTYAYEKNT